MHSWHEVKDRTEIGLNKINIWLDSFGLTLNVQKTNYIAFSLTEANRPNFKSIHIGNFNDSIIETGYTKYLGIIIDKHLKWDHHILYLTKNLRKLIHKFYVLREILSKRLLISVYKVIAESVIRYGIVVWGGLYHSALKQLNVVQNYILKVINKKNKRFSTRQLYTTEILNVRSLYIVEICSFVFKNYNLKRYVNHMYEIRNKTNKHISIPKSNSNINLRFVNYLAPKIYNIIPVEIKDIKKIKPFRRACRLYVVENLKLFEPPFLYK